MIPKEYKEEKIGIGVIVSKASVLAVVLLALSLLAYGGLFLYQRPLIDQLQDLQAEIEEVKKQRDEDFEEEAESLYAVLKSLNPLLENHLYWSNIFSKIEELTVPRVSFADFNGTIAESGGSPSVTLSGKTAGYTYLAKQMKSFSQEELVSDIKVSGIQLSTEGGIEFGLYINFAKDILLSQ